ncbi:hypothetical protein [Rubritalea tangerina]|uniref:Type II secretion system protein n=1 Tax=Rubritalea tangerina TaxID=430798 RepID=A0ABW4ZC87_9BACT
MKISLLGSPLQKTRAVVASPGAKKRRGGFLIESSVSLFVLVAVAIVLLNASFNIVKPRNWVMRQNLVDAFLSQEIALMNRVSFDTIENGTSGWGSGSAATANLANAVSANDVLMGKMPGFTPGVDNGRDFTATVHRVRIPVETNTAVGTFTPSGTNDELVLADLGIRCYELQSHVVYTIDGETYVKTRSVIRTQ